MFCPKCGAENTEGNKYCQKCGAPIGVEPPKPTGVCAKCGTQNAEGTKYCRNCGAMLDIPGLGPKKMKVLHDELGLETLEQLEQACKAGTLAGLKGFGEKTQTNILEGINRRRSYASRHLISEALPRAEPLLEAVRSHPEVGRGARSHRGSSPTSSSASSSRR